MPNYLSSDKVKSGVPLGGIGAGKLEILPNGTLDYITYQNNWHNPLYNPLNDKFKYAQGLLGYHFGIYVEERFKKFAKLLQTKGVANLPKVKKIKFQGTFPYAKLRYIDRDLLPLKVELDAFSPFIPGDYKNSALPGTIFSFNVENLSKNSKDISIMFIVRNIIGSDSIGRYNLIKKDRKLVGINLKIKNPLSIDSCAGEVTIAAPISGAEVSYLGEWNMQKENFKFNAGDLRLDAWQYFVKDGTLPNVNTQKCVQSGSVELGAALAVKFRLSAHQRKEIPFVYSWRFPPHPFGHIYEIWFKSSWEVAKYLTKSKLRLKKRTDHFQKIVLTSSLPYWLKDALVNNLYTFFSSSWWTRKDEFIMYEAPLICPLMGTFDVHFYGSIPLAFLFPELEKRVIEQFKKAQRASGYIPHDLGRERIDMPSNGTTFYLWKDLNPKFVLVVYRDYLWTEDLEFLRDMYPAVKKALEHSFSLDKDGDFLPENEGADQTFDTWYFYGANSYTSGIFLAALKAALKMAKIMEDSNFESKCRRWYERAKRSFEDKLWNGRYFIVSVQGKRSYDSCMAGQLVGQWYAYLLNLELITSRQKIRKALKAIFSLNGKDSKYGLTNSVFPDGKRDKSSLHSKTIWPAICYAVASLAIYEGFIKEGLTIAKRTWENIALAQKNPWNQADLIYPDRGTYGFGDYYMRNACIWAIPFALAKHNKTAKDVLISIKEFVKGKIIYSP